MVVVSAQEACATRLCAAEACGNDAETNHHLCWRCQRKDSVRLHTTPSTPTPGDPNTETLYCCSCRTHHPDNEYSRNHANHSRRGRGSECKLCAAERKRRERSLWTEAQRQHERERKVLSNRRRRALIAELKAGLE